MSRVRKDDIQGVEDGGQDAVGALEDAGGGGKEIPADVGDAPDEHQPDEGIGAFFQEKAIQRDFFAAAGGHGERHVMATPGYFFLLMSLGLILSRLSRAA